MVHWLGGTAVLVRDAWDRLATGYRMRLQRIKDVRGGYMKKTIVIAVIVVSVIVAVGLIIGRSLFKNEEEAPLETLETEPGYVMQDEFSAFCDGEEWFYVHSKDDIRATAEKYGYEASFEEENVAVENVRMSDLPMRIEYSMLDGDEYSRMSILIVPFLDEFESDVRHTGAELKEKTLSALALLERVTGSSFDNRFYIVKNDELLDNELDSSYESVLSGEAQIRFSLRYSDGTYWTLYSTYYGNHVRFEVLRFFDPQYYSDSIVSVDLS